MSGSAIRLNWDLDSIFPGGSSSEQFQDFKNKIAADIDQATEEAAKLPRRLDASTRDSWLRLFQLIQDTEMRLHEASSFAYCLVAQDIEDEKARILVEEVTSLEARLEQLKTNFEELAVATDDETWAGFMEEPAISGMAFYWNERRRNARLKMQPELERLAAELAVSGYHAWNRLYTKIASDLRVEWSEDGKKEISISQLANKMASPQRHIRQLAFEKFERAWQSIEDLVAIELNALAGFWLSLYRARRWEEPTFEAFLMGRVRPETISAMWDAVASARDAIARYVKAKKRLLGIDDFRWYDQLAPIQSSEKRYSYAEAAEFIVKHLSTFSEEMGEFARMAIDKQWIEAEDRPGKVPGGFCTSFPVTKQTRIFMTYSGNYTEMMTLAHELGHAFHSWVLRDRAYYARKYPMTLAETASTFNELLVTDAALAAASSRDEKISLLDRKLQEHLQMFCNIRCRYLFETRFYEERKQGPVPLNRLNQLMVEAQKEAYGDILAEDGYHPLFWASKLHFSETSVPFYNFPYTFGHLFASAIYRLARSAEAGFFSRYRSLLADTGSMNCEDLASKHLRIDISTSKFWHEAVSNAIEDVEEFLSLAG